MNMTMTEINFENVTPMELNEMINEGALLPIPHYAESALKYPVFVTKEVWLHVIDNDPLVAEQLKTKSIYIKSLDICNMLSFYFKSFYMNDNEVIQFPMIRMAGTVTNEIELTCTPVKNIHGKKMFIVSI